MTVTLRRTVPVVAGFLAALAILYVLLTLVGVSDVVAALRVAEPVRVVTAFLIALLWMGAWSVSTTPSDIA